MHLWLLLKVRTQVHQRGKRLAFWSANLTPLLSSIRWYALPSPYKSTNCWQVPTLSTRYVTSPPGPAGPFGKMPVNASAARSSSATSVHLAKYLVCGVCVCVCVCLRARARARVRVCLGKGGSWIREHLRWRSSGHVREEGRVL